MYFYENRIGGFYVSDILLNNADKLIGNYESFDNAYNKMKGFYSYYYLVLKLCDVFQNVKTKLYSEILVESKFLRNICDKDRNRILNEEEYINSLEQIARGLIEEPKKSDYCNGVSLDELLESNQEKIKWTFEIVDPEK